MTYPYVWTWRQRDGSTVHPAYRGVKVPWFGDGKDRAGQACRVIARGGMNSALIEFDDGYQVVTSRGGLRKRHGTEPDQGQRSQIDAEPSTDADPMSSDRLAVAPTTPTARTTPRGIS